MAADSRAASCPGPLAVLIGLVGCAATPSPSAVLTPGRAGPEPDATTPVGTGRADAPPPGPALAVATSAPVEGEVGSSGFVAVLAASPAGDWVMLCQARSDTDGDGRLGVRFGHHGELFGDDPAPYLVRGRGLGEELGQFVAADDGGRHVVIVRGSGQDAALELVTPSTGARRVLAGADLRYVEGAVFAGDRAAFDASGEHVVYSRFVAAAAPAPGKGKGKGKRPAPAAVAGQRTLVVHRVVDGHEVTIDPGPGHVHDVQLSGGWARVLAWEPRRAAGIRVSHRSGPDHTVGGRRCWGDRTADVSGDEARWAPLTGGAAAYRDEVVLAVGADLVVRDEAGGLGLARAGGAEVVALTPPACAGGVLGRDHGSGALLVGCASTAPAPLHLWQGGALRALGMATPNPPAAEGYRSELDGQFAQIADDGAGERVVAIEVSRGADRHTVVLDLATGHHHGAGGYYPLYQHGGVMVLHQREGGLALFDGERATWTALPGTPPDLMTRLGRGRLFVAGRRHDAAGDAAPSVVVDLAAGVTLGTVAAAPVALATTGWVLAPVPPPPCSPGGACPARILTGAADGPLRWIRPSR